MLSSTLLTGPLFCFNIQQICTSKIKVCPTLERRSICRRQNRLLLWFMKNVLWFEQKSVEVHVCCFIICLNIWHRNIISLVWSWARFRMLAHVPSMNNGTQNLVSVHLLKVFHSTNKNPFRKKKLKKNFMHICNLYAQRINIPRAFLSGPLKELIVSLCVSLIFWFGFWEQEKKNWAKRRKHLYV